MYERFVARQPIFDQHLEVFGYELLFRAGRENGISRSEHATAHVIVDSTMLLRLDQLIGPGRAFLNMTPEEIRGGSAFLLSNTKTVIELSEPPNADHDTILACQNLQQSGYQLALDGFRDISRWKPLLPFASFLKVDFRTTSGDEQQAIAKSFTGAGLKLIGKRIESREEFAHASKYGYSMFQGFFFLRPQIVVARDLPAGKLNCLRLLRETAASQLRYDEIERILKQEPSLLYKLLRYLNSPALGLSREVRSVPYALTLLGEKEFRRWVSVVAVVAASADEPVELLRSALVRAYFCEGLSALLQGGRVSGEFFLLGLLSLMDVLFRRPMREILEDLPISADICTALLGGTGPFRDVLEAALAYETADWDRFHEVAERARLDQLMAAEKYEAAVLQASSLHQQAS